MKNLNTTTPFTLNHIAIAVKDLEASVKIFELLGFHFNSKREVVAEQKVTTAFAEIGGSAHLELLQGTTPESTISQYVDKKGNGIHHLCFNVEDIHSTCQDLIQKGMRMIYDKPRAGANNTMINFIHPKSTGGILIELTQQRGK